MHVDRVPKKEPRSLQMAQLGRVLEDNYQRRTGSEPAACDNGSVGKKCPYVGLICQA